MSAACVLQQSVHAHVSVKYNQLRNQRRPHADSDRQDTERMRDMLVLLIGLLHWTRAEGVCSGTLVSISGDNRMLPAGEAFRLSCEFTCLKAEHVAQLWRRCEREDKVSLVNITSILPDVTVVLNIKSATKEDAGNYCCMTQPPDTISPSVLIQVADNLTRETSTLTTPSSPRCSNIQQSSSAAGLQGQIWCWMLLGKTAILLLSLASLAIKCKRG